MASPARLSWQISIFPKKTFLSNFKLWEIVFMGFLTHRNLPETLGSHIQKKENFGFFDFFCMVGFLGVVSFFSFFKNASNRGFRPSNHVESIGHGQLYTIHANESSRKSLLMPLMTGQSFQKRQHLSRFGDF